MKKYLVIALLMGMSSCYTVEVAQVSLTKVFKDIVKWNAIRIIRALGKVEINIPGGAPSLFSDPYGERTPFKQALMEEMQKAGSTKITLEIVIKTLARYYPNIRRAAYLLDLIEMPYYVARPQFVVVPSVHIPQKFTFDTFLPLQDCGMIYPLEVKNLNLGSFSLELTPEQLNYLTSPESPYNKDLSQTIDGMIQELEDQEYLKKLEELMFS